MIPSNDNQHPQQKVQAALSPYQYVVGNVAHDLPDLATHRFRVSQARHQPDGTHEEGPVDVEGIGCDVWMDDDEGEAGHELVAKDVDKVLIAVLLLASVQ